MINSYEGLLNNPFFKQSEFDSPDKKGSGHFMDVIFINRLTSARIISDSPFFITSGYRSKAHNKAVGGKKYSSHLKGFACDISCTSSRQRYNILGGLLLAGFTRIGISNDFIHVDSDPSKPQEVFWLY